MADTETIHNDENLAKVKSEPVPDRAQTLALSAIDDAFQEHVKLLFQVACQGSPTGEGEFENAANRAMAGYRSGVVMRTELRKRINNG